MCRMSSQAYSMLRRKKLLLYSCSVWADRPREYWEGRSCIFIHIQVEIPGLEYVEKEEAVSVFIAARPRECWEGRSCIFIHVQVELPGLEYVEKEEAVSVFMEPELHKYMVSTISSQRLHKKKSAKNHVQSKWVREGGSWMKHVNTKCNFNLQK